MTPAHARNVQLQFSTERWCLDSALIRFLTWSDISHVDIILPVTGQLLGAQVRCGVHIRPPSYAKFTHIIRAEVEHSASIAGQVHNLAMQECGKPYDRGGIFNFFLHRNWRSTDRWFCSELIAWVFEKAGSPLLNAENIPHNRVTPRDLLLAPRVRVIKDITPGRLSS